jgi:hypothetical protein
LNEFECEVVRNSKVRRNGRSVQCGKDRIKWWNGKRFCRLDRKDGLYTLDKGSTEGKRQVVKVICERSQSDIA